MEILEEDYLAHYGILRRSGRYPWGSGGNTETRSRSFLSIVEGMKKEAGMLEKDIAKGFGMSITELRQLGTIANNQIKLAEIGMAQRLKKKGLSNVEGAKRMGIPESTFRSLIAPEAKRNADILTNTANMLQRQVDEKHPSPLYLGTGVENQLGITATRLSAAVAMLRDKGYSIHNVPVPQLGTGLNTTAKVLVKPGVTQKQAWENRYNIRQIQEHSTDSGFSYSKPLDPLSIHPNRVKVAYAADGGGQADGVLFVREGVSDVSLGKNRYAQVRVQVGDSHYLKGMAMYKDGLPPGVDIVFNTNKKSTGNKLDAMKSLSADPELPFGAIVRQIKANEGTPKEHVTSVMNIVNEQGDWAGWSRNLSSQFLSKQSPKLAREQLAKLFDARKQDIADVKALTNPTVRKHLLEKLADSADSAAVHLKAAALPGQNWHAILPIASMKPTEIYAPGYRPGTKVALVRYPHGGTFEIPELIVNNRQPEAKKLLGDASDAVGIHHSVAQWLSGADFDGDTVLVIPNDSNKVTTTRPLDKLKSFDPMVYKLPADSPIPRISAKRMQQEMGNISNLITDMTIQLAPQDHIARAVAHSMVVIDAEKHGLNYKQSALDHGIAQLKIEYQGGANRGASTLISRKKSPSYGPELKPRSAKEGGSVNPKTGVKEFVPSNRTTRNKSGEIVTRKAKFNRLALTTDAHSLSSGTPIERIYAEHSNSLKDLANKTRLEVLATPSLKYSPSAKKTYAKEVASLDHKLKVADANRPLELQAQVIAGGNVRQRLAANPNLEPETIKKIKYQALEEARRRMGANKKERQVVLTQEEWNAIQAGAISNNRLQDILKNADIEQIRQLATPHHTPLMTTSKTARARDLLDRGYTRAEVADYLGVSLSTLDNATHGKD